MTTAIKAIKHLINAVLWTVVCLYILLITVSKIPDIQRSAAKEIAEILEKELGTHVTIARVDAGWLNRIIVDSIRIEDRRGQNLLSANRVATRIDIWQLLTEKRIMVNTAQLFDASVNLYKDSTDAELNAQFIIDLLASDNKGEEKPLDLSVGSLIIRRGALDYHQKDAPQTPGTINDKHLKVRNISAHIILHRLTDDRIDLSIKRIALKEQSGIDISKLSLNLTADTNGMTLKQLTLDTPESKLETGTVEACYTLEPGSRLLKSPKLKSGSLKWQAPGIRLTLDTKDLHPYLPRTDLPRKTITMEANLNGTDKTVSLNSLTLETSDQQLRLDAKGQASSKEGGRPIEWEADIEELFIDKRLTQELTTYLKLNDQTVRTAERAGNILLTGNARSANGSTAIRMAADTEAGMLTALADADSNGNGKLKLDITGLNLKTLSGGNPDLGMVSATIKAEGRWKGKRSGTVAMTSDRLELKGHDYRGLSAEATVNGNRLDGIVVINQEHIAARISLSTLLDKTKEAELTADISRFEPMNLNLSDRWGKATMKATVHAGGKWENINRMEGRLTVNDLVVSAQDGYDNDYRINQLSVNVNAGENGKKDISVNGDFGDAGVTGNFDYQTLAQSIVNRVADKLPTFPGLPQKKGTTDNRLHLWANINETEWARRLTGVDITLRKPVSLNVRMDDRNNHLAFHASLPDFIYKGNDYANGSVVLYSPDKDSLHLNAHIRKVTPEGKTTRYRVRGNAAGNALNTSFVWRMGEDRENSGEINTTARFDYNEKGKERAIVSVRPSIISIDGAAWEVSPSLITYSDRSIDIDSFAITHNNQHIRIDGRGSTATEDSINISLNGLDIEYVLNLVNFHSVDFGGKATGKAWLKAPFADLEAKAALTVEQFTFEHGRMGTLDADVSWNKETKHIDIDAKATETPDRRTVIKGYVEPSPGHIDLAITAEGTSVEFMQSFTKSFTSYVKGTAQGEVRVAGPLSNINLTGELVVNGETHVKTIGCTYRLNNDTVRCIPDEIELNRLAITDKDGNRGWLNGGIHHKHLTNLSYDLSVEADNLLAYDFKDFGDETFYGTVYGSGKVDIHGKSGEVQIDIDMTPQPKSVFVYNAASPDAITNQEFITWGETHGKNGITDTRGHAENAGTIMEDIPSDMYINFLINCLPDVKIKLLMDAKTNDYITLGGHGTIRATYYNKGSFNMYGTYNVDNGTYGLTIQDIIKKNFLFNEGGTIVFGGNPYDANLNLQAVHTVNAVSLSDLNIGNSFSNSNTTKVNCLMNITGQPKAPKVDFDIDLPTVSTDEKQLVRSVINGEEEMNQQVVYLLGIGRFYPQGANNAGIESDNQQNQTTLAMQSLLSGTISGQVNSLLNAVVKSNNWNFGANISTGNEGWNNAEYEGLLSGRLLNNRLLINGQFGYRDNATTADASFIGDFDVRYLLIPNGNLAVKVYNQTNDRYFTRNSLNTQGIGLIMKKDFINLKDFFKKR